MIRNITYPCLTPTGYTRIILLLLCDRIIRISLYLLLLLTVFKFIIFVLRKTMIYLFIYFKCFNVHTYYYIFGIVYNVCVPNLLKYYILMNFCTSKSKKHAVRTAYCVLFLFPSTRSRLSICCRRMLLKFVFTNRGPFEYTTIINYNILKSHSYCRRACLQKLKLRIYYYLMFESDLKKKTR